MRIDDMSVDQLMELNRYICQRIHELREQENLQVLSQLRVGLKVTFEGREGPVLGVVTKINRKSVIVLDEEDGTKQYKVSPGLVRPLRDVK
ncbi:hypothetical protein [Marinobacter salarius]|jgi:hypothetical protein|uniref:hypothetical protein n=1 Tax=Marinobacter salarius TaxID=1420917 RepID=UPI000F853B09|nr:hypothetical protein [Marinobacter salarius]AZR43541.1 hypothetical protein MTMN5_04116 [Marinobacter salarius]